MPLQAFGSVLGSYASKTPVASPTIAVNAAVAAGSVVLVAGGSGSSTTLPSGVTDARGNTYALVGSRNTTAPTSFLYQSVLGTALQSGDLITIAGVATGGTFVAIAASASGTLASGTADRTSSNGITTNSTAVTSNATATTRAQEELLVGVVVLQGATGITATQNGDGLGGAWTLPADGRVGTTGGSAATNVSLQLGYEVVSATGAYAYRITLGTARPWSATIGTDYAVGAALAPAVASASPSSVDPTVAVAGGAPTIRVSWAELQLPPAVAAPVTVAPAPASAGAASLNPSVVKGPIAVTVVASAAAATSGPTVEAGIPTSHDLDTGLGGYTDAATRQSIRTPEGRLYAFVANCDSYPACSTNGLTQALRAYRAGQVGVATSLAEQDAANHPTGILCAAAAMGTGTTVHVAWIARTVAYNASGARVARYAAFDTSTNLWGTVETIESTTWSQDFGQGHESLAMAVDANGVPHVVYLGTVGGVTAVQRVRYSNRTGGTWSTPATVDDQSFGANERCWHPGASFDPDGRLLVTWIRGTFNTVNDGAVFSRVRSAAGTFGTTVNLATGVLTGIDNTVSSYVDPAGRYHVAYTTASTTSQVRYRYSDDQGASWSTNNPGGGAMETHDPALGPGPGGTVRIYGHDAAGANMAYVQGAGGASAWGAVQTYAIPAVGGGYDSSPNARWAQFYHHHANYLDLLFWDENYGNVLHVGVDSTSIVVLNPVASGGAVAVDPTVSAGSNVVVSPTPAAAASVTTSPSVVAGSLALAPTGASASLTGVNPSILGGGLQLAPSPAAASLESVAPAVLKGATSAAPTPGVGSVATTAPTVVQSSLALTPPSATAGVTATGGTVVLGSLAFVPSIASAALSTSVSVAGGGVQVSPTVASASAASIAPSVVKGALSVAPTASSAVAATTGATVVTGSTSTAPAPAAAAVSSSAAVVQGALALTPAVSSASATTVNPTVLKGALVLTGIAAAGAVTVAPTLVLTSTTASPAPASAVAGTAGPTVAVIDPTPVFVSPTSAIVSEVERYLAAATDTRTRAVVGSGRLLVGA